MLLLGEGGEVQFNTNVNFLLEDYGMTINNGISITLSLFLLCCSESILTSPNPSFALSADVVVRPQYYKYFHPKEALISGGVSCDTMNNLLLEGSKSILTSFDFMDDKYKVEVGKSIFKPITISEGGRINDRATWSLDIGSVFFSFSIIAFVLFYSPLPHSLCIRSVRQ